MSRYWVRVPGEANPRELTLSELADRQRSGKLPAGTLAAKFGEDQWLPVETIPEVLQAKVRRDDDARPSLEAVGPPSSSAHGAELMELPPSLGPTLLGETLRPDEQNDASRVDVGAPPPPPPPPPRAPSRVSVSRTLLAALASVLFVLACGGTVLCVWYRYGYAHGAVFEHIPGDCAVLEYVDFGAIEDSPAVKDVAKKRDRSLTDWVEDVDDEEGVRRSDDDDAKGRASTLRTLRRLGIRPYDDVKEVAYCEIHDEGTVERLVAIGGSFRGKDLLGAIREGILHRDRKHKDDKLRLDDVEGRPYLRLDDERYATMATSQVVLIGPKKVIERYVASRPVAREYGIQPGEVIVRHWLSSGPAQKPADAGAGDATPQSTTDERYRLDKGKLTVTRVWNGTAGDVTTSLEKFKALGDRLRKVDGLDALADDFVNADVRLEGNEVRAVVSFGAGDVGNATKAIVDSDYHDMRPMIDALRGAVGGEYFHYVVVPGVDAFDLHLSPW